MNEIFGLPAHPLIVHAAVVLVPLAAVGVVVTAFWPAARRRLAIATLVVAAGGAGFAFLGVQSGEQLQERVRETRQVEEHAELGDSGTAAGAAVFLGALGLAGVEVVGSRRREQGGLDPRIAIGVGVVAVLLSVGGTVQIARIGHSGAKATWDDLPAESEGAER